MLNKSVINKIIELGKENNVNIKYTGEGKYILFDTDFKQNFKYVSIYFSSIKDREEFYINIPAFNLYPSKNELNEFIKEVNKISILVNKLNEYVNKLK